MTEEQAKFHRRSIRLKGYDYSQSGAYFVTICTRNRECLFGEITTLDEQSYLHLNQFGEIAHACLLEIPRHFSN